MEACAPHPPPPWPSRSAVSVLTATARGFKRRCRASQASFTTLVSNVCFQVRCSKLSCIRCCCFSIICVWIDSLVILSVIKHYFFQQLSFKRREMGPFYLCIKFQSFLGGGMPHTPLERLGVWPSLFGPAALKNFQLLLFSFQLLLFIFLKPLTAFWVAGRKSMFYLLFLKVSVAVFGLKLQLCLLK